MTTEFLKTILRTAVLWLGAAALTVSLSTAQTSPTAPPAKTAAVEYYGQLDAELSPDTGHLYGVLLKHLVNPDKLKFARPPEKDAFVAVGAVTDARGRADAEIGLILVEPKDGAPYFYVDLNADGTLQADEKLSPAPVASGSDDFGAILKLPISHPFYKSFPIYLQFKKGFLHPNLPNDQRLIFQSFYVFALGTVRIENKNVRVQYPFDQTSPAISTTEGLFGIDADGDGKIDNRQFSPETSYAANDEIPFRWGGIYLSTSLIDLAKNRIVMRQRAASEYRRIDLEPGKEMPDFTFVDFEDKKRSLKDFRGKYLLIDFWGLWCVDCRRELPFQIAAYRRFRGRGFEILGLDSDETEKLAWVKANLAKNNITWPQARYDSIKDLIEKSYRIQEYPSAILLDPNGKVLILDQKPLTGEELLETLDRVLPK
ncbi:MAG: TlpA family protein disulfide reductase [Acidobacteria bacterium]|nr:TlpA family protein disulfide reductase [Acidobacteriota bacterium]